MAASYSPFWKRLSKSGGSARPASTPRRFSSSTTTGPIAGPDAPKPMMLTLRRLPCGSVQKPSPSFEALSGEQTVGLLGRKFVGVVFGQQILDRVEIGQQRRIGRQRQLRGGVGAEIANLDQLLTVEVMAQCPAHILVVEGRALVVDIERDRPPVHVAVRRALSGMGGDLGVLAEHRRKGSGLQGGARIELIGDQRLCGLLLAGNGQRDVALDRRQRCKLAVGRPPARTAVKHLLLRRGVV